MAFEDEQKIFDAYVRKMGMKQSEQRRDILFAFLETEKHLTADELHGIVKQKNSSIGAATVYRTLKILCECGLCREFRLNDGTARYEHLYGHDHHDHLICTNCGALVEALDPEIERLQEKLATTHGFAIQSHKLEIYGLCRKCNT